jgi:hypothetical protein
MFNFSFSKVQKIDYYFFTKITLKIGTYAYICTHKRGYGEIGRRARLRIWCRKACRFESYYPHKVKCNSLIFRELHFFISLYFKSCPTIAQHFKNTYKFSRLFNLRLLLIFLQNLKTKTQLKIQSGFMRSFFFA